MNTSVKIQNFDLMNKSNLIAGTAGAASLFTIYKAFSSRRCLSIAETLLMIPLIMIIITKVRNTGNTEEDDKQVWSNIIMSVVLVVIVYFALKYRAGNGSNRPRYRASNLVEAGSFEEYYTDKPVMRTSNVFGLDSSYNN